MTAVQYLTPHRQRNARAAARRIDAVEYMDEVTAVWPDPRTRPPGAAAAHDQAATLVAEKES